jgi:hypothetical protein
VNDNEDWDFDEMPMETDVLAEFTDNATGSSAVVVAVDDSLLDVDVLQVAPTADRSRIVIMASRQFMHEMWTENDRDMRVVADWVVQNGVVLADQYFSMNPPTIA